MQQNQNANHEPQKNNITIHKNILEEQKRGLNHASEISPL